MFCILWGLFRTQVYIVHVSAGRGGIQGSGQIWGRILGHFVSRLTTARIPQTKYETYPPNLEHYAYRTQILPPPAPPPLVIKYLVTGGSICSLIFDFSRGRILGHGPPGGEKYWVSVHYIHLWLSMQKPNL